MITEQETTEQLLFGARHHWTNADCVVVGTRIEGDTGKKKIKTELNRRETHTWVSMLCIWPSGRLFSSRQNTQKKKRDTLSSTSIVSRRRRRRRFYCVYFMTCGETSNGDQTVCVCVWCEQTFQQIISFWERRNVTITLCVCDDGRVTMSQCAALLVRSLARDGKNEFVNC